MVKKQESKIHKEIMAEAEESKALSQKSADKLPQELDNDEDVLKYCNPNGKFIALHLGHDRYRVVNKRKQWVSPVLSLKEASALTVRFNQKDPEQKSFNKKQGIWLPGDRI